jgi:hypothetical protein
MNGRIYDPVLGRMLSPDNYTHSGTQGLSRYAYVYNNPLKYTDPSGEFPWLIPIIGAVVFGTGNLVAHAIRGDVNSFGDGLKYFAQGAIVGAALGVGIAYGLQVPILGTVIKGIGWAQAGSTTFSLIGGTIAGGDGLPNAGKLFLSNFYIDENKSFLGGVWEGISRHTWQILQTNVGYNTAQISNGIGKISRVDYWGGATFSYHKYNGSSISLGNNILLADSDPWNQLVPNDKGYTAMHEYGHYIQSQANGFAYLFKHGIASAGGASWTELDANLRASRYFDKHYNFDWDQNFFTGSTSIYSQFPKNGSIKNLSW